MARTKFSKLLSDLLYLHTAPRWFGKKWLAALALETGFLLLLSATAYFVHHKRPDWIQPSCIQNPATCKVDLINAFDRFAIGKQNARADASSFTTQNWSAYLALGVPAVYLIFKALTRVFLPLSALAHFAIHCVMLFQATALNFAMNEIVRSIVQRPRPFVFEDVQTHGKLVSHYTSFYSGHVSFSSLAIFGLVFGLISLKAPKWLVWTCGIFGSLLVFYTAYFRIIAGRHYPTDTLFGAFAGLVAIWFIHRLHRGEIAQLKIK